MWVGVVMIFIAVVALVVYNRMLRLVSPDRDMVQLLTGLPYSEAQQLQVVLCGSCVGLPKKLIDTIEVIHVSPQIIHDKVYEKLEHDECIVCMAQFCMGESLRKLKCNHFYHQECIDSWLLKSVQCPLCRSEVI
mmetsp:Transcript_1553/g.2584  ORF Transcript_1553/g.2584 Transcript_1553/m.2584 type:complete len:134 (-) Transcript_1553:1078-1479(-)